MGMQKVAADYRLMKWSELMQKRLDSGQSIKDFCESSGINRNQYYYWQRKLRKVACKELIEPINSKAIISADWVELADVTSSNSTLDI